MSAPALPYPGPDIDRGGKLIGIWATFCSVAFVAVVVRFWARIRTRSLGWDDAFMAATWFVYLGDTIVICIFAANGGTRHQYYLTEPQGEYLDKLNYIAQPMSVTTYGLGKISVALLLLRIFGNATYWGKRLIWALIAWTAIFTIITAIIAFAQCQHPQALWNPAVQSYCWNPAVNTDISIALGAWNSAADFALAVFPLPFVWRMNQSVQRRLGLTVLLGLGVFASACSIVKTIQLSSLSNHADLTWATYDLAIWVTTESFVIIVCGSVPSYRPLVSSCLASRRGGDEEPVVKGRTHSTFLTIGRHREQQLYEKTSAGQDSTLAPSGLGESFGTGSTPITARGDTVYTV